MEPNQPPPQAAPTTQSPLCPQQDKTRWKPHEDTKLVQLVNQYGPKMWNELAKHMPGRHGKQLRERWLNHLDPTITHTAWTEQENAILVQKQAELGNHWSQIRPFLPGRPDNSIKNQWHWVLKRRVETSQAALSAAMTSMLGMTTNLPGYIPSATALWASCLGLATPPPVPGFPAPALMPIQQQPTPPQIAQRAPLDVLGNVIVCSLNPKPGTMLQQMAPQAIQADAGNASALQWPIDSLSQRSRERRPGKPSCCDLQPQPSIQGPANDAQLLVPPVAKRPRSARARVARCDVRLAWQKGSAEAAMPETDSREKRSKDPSSGNVMEQQQHLHDNEHALRQAGHSASNVEQSTGKDGQRKLRSLKAPASASKENVNLNTRQRRRALRRSGLSAAPQQQLEVLADVACKAVRELGKRLLGKRLMGA